MRVTAVHLSRGARERQAQRHELLHPAVAQVTNTYSCSLVRTFDPSSSVPSMWKITRMMPDRVVVGMGAKKGTSTAPELPVEMEAPETGMICSVSVVPPIIS